MWQRGLSIALLLTAISLLHDLVASSGSSDDEWMSFLNSAAGNPLPPPFDFSLHDDDSFEKNFSEWSTDQNQPFSTLGNSQHGYESDGIGSNTAFPPLMGSSHWNQRPASPPRQGMMAVTPNSPRSPALASLTPLLPLPSPVQPITPSIPAPHSPQIEQTLDGKRKLDGLPLPIPKKPAPMPINIEARLLKQKKSPGPFGTPCGVVYKVKEQLYNHLLKCEVCFEIAPEHPDRRVPEKECNICGSLFLRRNELREHIFLKHDPASVCQWCHRRFKSKKGWSTHRCHAVKVPNLGQQIPQ